MNREAARAQEWYGTVLPGEVLTISRGMNNSPLEVKLDWGMIISAVLG